MQIKKPKVYILASTQLTNGFEDFLKDNDIKWRPENDISPAEALTELSGRMCYESWPKEDGTFDNKNISKIREGNDVYIQNVINSGHGSIFEHSTVSFLFNNVTRVFTHELVRHRVGTAFSQTSGRYVRANDISLYIPEIIQENDKAKEIFVDVTKYIEDAVHELEKVYDINSIKDFATKKILTSAFRRIAPNGQCNNIVFTANHRTLRHLIELRTSIHAEIEIREVFDIVAKLMKNKFSNIYQDMSCNDNGEWVFENHKI